MTLDIRTNPAIPDGMIGDGTGGGYLLKVNSDGSINANSTFTPSGTQDVNLKTVNAVTVLTGAGATGTGSERVTVAVDSSTVAGSATLPAGTNIVGAVASAASGAAANAPSNVTSTAYEASHVIKASAGILYGFSGYNSKSSAQFILFYDSATVPADAAQAVLVLTVPATSNFSYDPGIYGRKFTTGISWSNSSTAPTKTVGSADCFLDAQFT